MSLLRFCRYMILSQRKVTLIDRNFDQQNKPLLARKEMHARFLIRTSLRA